METFLIIVHLILVIALTGSILLQNFDSDGFGSAPSSSTFTKVRGRGDALTRLTSILGACFFLTSLGLSVFIRYYGEKQSDVIHRIENLAPSATTPLPSSLDSPKESSLNPLQNKESLQEKTTKPSSLEIKPDLTPSIPK